MDAPRTVWRNLRHWTLHVCLSASGSFAAAYSANWHSTQAVVGMAGGILLFICLYAWVWSSPWFQRRVPTGGTAERALLYATRLRSAIGVCGWVSVALLPVNKMLAGILWLPFVLDIFAAILLGSFVDAVGRSSYVRSIRTMVAGSDPHQRAQSMLVGDVNSLLPTFLITVAQGVLLSLMLLAFAWVCEAVLLYRARRNQVTHPDAIPPSL